MHHLIRVIRGRVSYHRDLVAKFSGKANCRFDAGMRNEPDNDELLNATVFKLQIQICIGKTTGTPMLGGNNFAWLRLESTADLAAPRAVFKAFPLPCCFL